MSDVPGTTPLSQTDLNAPNVVMRMEADRAGSFTYQTVHLVPFTHVSDPGC